MQLSRMISVLVVAAVAGACSVARLDRYRRRIVAIAGHESVEANLHAD